MRPSLALMLLLALVDPSTAKPKWLRARHRPVQHPVLPLESVPSLERAALGDEGMALLGASWEPAQICKVSTQVRTKPFSTDKLPVGSYFVLFVIEGAKMWVPPADFRPFTGDEMYDFEKNQQTVALDADLEKEASKAERAINMILFSARALTEARQEALGAFRLFTKEYRQQLHKSKVGTTAGESAAIVGSVMLLGGPVCAIVGGCILVAGSIGSISSQSYQKAKANEAAKEMQATIEEDRENMGDLQAALQAYHKYVKYVMTTWHLDAEAATALAWIVHGGTKTVKLGTKVSKLINAIKAAKGVEGGLSVRIKAYLYRKAGDLAYVAARGIGHQAKAAGAIGVRTTARLGEFARWIGSYTKTLTVVAVGFSVYTIISTWATKDPTEEELVEQEKKLHKSKDKVEKLFKTLLEMNEHQPNPAQIEDLNSGKIVIGTLATRLFSFGGASC